MIRLAAIAALFLLGSFTMPNLKPVTYYMEEELKKAGVVAEVKVYLKPEGKLGFVKLATGDTLTAQGDTTDYFKLGNGQLSGTAPKVGDTVLFVGSAIGPILYAKIGKHDYRFWSPAAPWSVPEFQFSAPFRPLKGEKAIRSLNDIRVQMCRDGCLLKKEELVRWRKN